MVQDQIYIVKNPLQDTKERNKEHNKNEMERKSSLRLKRNYIYRK